MFFIFTDWILLVLEIAINYMYGSINYLWTRRKTTSQIIISESNTDEALTVASRQALKFCTT